MTCLISKFNSLNHAFLLFARKLESPLLLFIRLYIANIFWTSGKLKLDNWLNDDWDSTVYLFKDIHPVPFLPPELAAYMGTIGEVVLAVLFALGFMGRFAALGLLIMTGIIEISLPDSPTTLHIMWAMLIAIIMVRGAGAFSVDGLLMRKYCKPREDGASCPVTSDKT